MIGIGVLSNTGLKSAPGPGDSSSTKETSSTDLTRSVVAEFAAILGGVMLPIDQSKGQDSGEKKNGDKLQQSSKDSLTVASPASVRGLEFQKALAGLLELSQTQPTLQSDFPAGKEANSGGRVNQGNESIASLANRDIINVGPLGLAMDSQRTGMALQKSVGHTNPTVAELDKYKNIIAELLQELSGEIRILSPVSDKFIANPSGEPLEQGFGLKANKNFEQLIEIGRSSISIEPKETPAASEILSEQPILVKQSPIAVEIQVENLGAMSMNAEQPIPVRQSPIVVVPKVGESTSNASNNLEQPIEIDRSSISIGPKETSPTIEILSEQPIVAKQSPIVVEPKVEELAATSVNAEQPILVKQSPIAVEVEELTATSLNTEQLILVKHTPIAVETQVENLVAASVNAKQPIPVRQSPIVVEPKVGESTSHVSNDLEQPIEIGRSSISIGPKETSPTVEILSEQPIVAKQSPIVKTQVEELATAGVNTEQPILAKQTPIVVESKVAELTATRVNSEQPILTKQSSTVVETKLGEQIPGAAVDSVKQIFSLPENVAGSAGKGLEPLNTITRRTDNLWQAQTWVDSEVTKVVKNEALSTNRNESDISKNFIISKQQGSPAENNFTEGEFAGNNKEKGHLLVRHSNEEALKDDDLLTESKVNVSDFAAIMAKEKAQSGVMTEGKTVAAPPVWEQITNEMQRRFVVQHQEVKELEISLHPADLGKIQIALRWENGQVHLQCQASENATAGILQQNFAELRESLENIGISCGTLQMGLGGQQQHHQQQKNELNSDILRGGQDTEEEERQVRRISYLANEPINDHHINIKV